MLYFDCSYFLMATTYSNSVVRKTLTKRSESEHYSRSFLKRRKAIRIFLVDDNEGFIRVASRFLAACPGFEVIGYATNANYGVRRIRELQPDVVIIDLVMPGKGGFEIARIVKSGRICPRVIAISFKDMTHLKGELEAAGVDGAVAKCDFGDMIVPAIKKLFPLTRVTELEWA